MMVWPGVDGLAQRPFRIDDPFYQDESARRSFFDGFALTAKLSYRPAGTLGAGGAAPLFALVEAQEGFDRRGTVSASPAGGLGLSFNVDYEVAPQLDFSVVFEALGGASGNVATLSWLSLKQYWHDNGTDYAIRLSFDPHPTPTGGTIGLRQIDLAGILTSRVGRDVSFDMTGGVRRVRIGYERLLADNTPIVVEETDVVGPTTDVAFTRASGGEMRLQTQLNYHFDQASSHFFVAALYEGGRYDLVENYLSALLGGGGRSDRSHFWGHVVRVRTGVRWNRPSYQLAPFISFPAADWKGGNDLLDGQGRQRTLVGLRLTLR